MKRCWALLILLGGALAGCGYGFQGSRNPLLENVGIRTVYVKPLANNTYKSGVENVVYNALIRTILAHQRIRLVSTAEGADAILTGKVGTADFAMNGPAAASGLSPKSLGLPAGREMIDYPSLGDISVATIYMASLGCSFQLDRTAVPQGKSKGVWGASFTRSKPFAAANQLDVPGTTSALINESEFERALSDMATALMDEVHEQMLAMF